MSLAEQMMERREEMRAWLSQCREWVAKYDPVKPEWMPGDPLGEAPDIHHYAFMRVLSQKLPADAIIVSDTGGNQIMMGHAFQSKSGQRIFSSNGNSAMGTAMCSAIGAWFAAPQRPIICVIGDGGFQLNLQECQTIAHYKVPLKIFIFNNKILANTLLYQVQNGKKVLACNLESGYSCPDFGKVAAAYDIFYMRFDLHCGGYSLIDHALEMTEAVIFDAIHENFCDFAPRMTLWNAGIEEQFPPVPEQELKDNMLVPPLEGWENRRKQHKEIPDAYKG